MIRRIIAYGITFTLATAAGWLIWDQYQNYLLNPWTRDAQVRANVVGIAPRVDGPISQVAVSDNQLVKKGDLLFTIDPADFEAAVEQAEAQVQSLASTAIQAKQELDRQSDLFQKKVNPVRDFQNAQDAYAFTDIAGLAGWQLGSVQGMQIAIAREREMLMRQRVADLAKANEALRSCLDALASVPELDAFLGQVVAAITRQLGAVSSNLRVPNAYQKGMRIELLFQDGSVMSSDDAGYPERFQSVSLEELSSASLVEPYTVLNLSDPRAVMSTERRAYLQGLGVGTLLRIPLLSQGQVNGVLSFRFAEERDFRVEELEIARALATQASLAIHLTELARSAQQSAVLEERTRLAGEIHDSLAQCFTGITMQLGMAKELKTDRDSEVFNYVERAHDLAQFGLAEARRSVLSLQPITAKGSGLIESLQILAERSNIAGRLRCTFRSNLHNDESVPVGIRQDLLRIAQEAISNALRHAKSTAISVTLRADPPNLILKVKDNGIGISSEAKTRAGFGFVNIRARVKKLKGSLDIRTVPGRGTNIIVRVPFKQELGGETKVYTDLNLGARI